MKIGVSDFQDLRVILQQLLGGGYRTRSNSKHITDLRLLADRIKEEAGAELLQHDRQEKTRYLIRSELMDTYTNYLSCAYSLCELSDNKSSVYHAVLLQLLAEREAEAGTQVELTQNGLESIVTNAVHFGENNGAPLKLKDCVSELVEQGLLVKLQGEGQKDRFCLAPGLPPELTEGKDNLDQLHRLRILLSLFSERVMPQTWGYRVQEDLELLLEQLDPGWSRPEASASDTHNDRHNSIPLTKRDSRPGLVLDDEILWDLLCAHTDGRWVQLDFRHPDSGRQVRSCPLQPLAVRTNPGEGRSYLIAWSREVPNEKQTRPVVLPLDLIRRVYPLANTDGLRDPEQCHNYRKDWFRYSFQGYSPAERELDGRPAAPVELRMVLSFPEDLSEHDRRSVMRGLRKAETWKPLTDNTLTAEYQFTVTRPEDLEPLLLQYDRYVSAVETKNSDFGRRWMEQREIWRQYGILTPSPRVKPVLPMLQEKLEPVLERDSLRLFIPRYNSQVRNTIRLTNRWVLRNGGSSPEYDYMGLLDLNTTMLSVICFKEERKETKGHEKDAEPEVVGTTFHSQHKLPIPVRFSWPEMDWLERFLQDDFVRAFLDEEFCKKLVSFLTQRLSSPEAQGYCRRFEGNFCEMNIRTGFHDDRKNADAQNMKLVIEALTSRKFLEYQFMQGGEILTARGIPMRLEYKPGAGRLRLLVYEPEMDRFRTYRFIKWQSVTLLPEPIPEQLLNEYDTALQNYLLNSKRTCSLLVCSDTSVITRAVHVLQPFLESIRQEEGNQTRIWLTFHTFEAADVRHLLTLVAPGVLLEETDHPQLKELYQEYYPTCGYKA